MPRSLKKGPFVDEHLLRKVVAQNEVGDSDPSAASNEARPDVHEPEAARLAWERTIAFFERTLKA